VALSRRTAGALTAGLAVVASLVLAGSALGADNREVRIQDDCDQVTFDAAVRPGTCVGDGRTTFADFLAEFQDEGSVDRWRFTRTDFDIDSNGTIEVVNQGGELHTFSEVEFFGNSCVPVFDDPEAGNPFDCAADFPAKIVADGGVFPGTTREFSAAVLGPGVHLFECAIHPWMQATVDVRAEGNRRGRG
jgi:hypothetical protein